MDSSTGEATVYDLLAWEPSLRLAASITPEALLRRTIDWVLAARPISPMVPHLRGGELIILPQRVIREAGIALPDLLRELTAHPIAGVITDAPIDDGIATTAGLPMLRLAQIGYETERDLNQLLGARRQDVLRKTAEVEQTMALALANGGRPAGLLNAVRAATGMEISIVGPEETLLFTTRTGATLPEPHNATWVTGSAGPAHQVVVGPVAPAQHALARATVRQIGARVQQALQSTHAASPHGAARVAALNQLIRNAASAEPAMLVQESLNAGLVAGAPYRLVLAPAVAPAEAIRAALRGSGELLAAGLIGPRQAWFIDQTRGLLPPVVADNSIPWLAISAARTTAAALATSLQEASYVAALLEGGQLPRGVVAHDDVRAMGVWLVLSAWPAAMLRHFRDAWLGAVVADDPRGVLLETLQAWLDHGQSPGETAAALAIHRNTLGYRLKQLRALIGPDLAAPEKRTSLELALAAHAVITLPHDSVL